MTKKEDRIQATQIAMHSVRNMLGDQHQISLFSDHDKQFANEFDLPLSGSIDRFGIDLTDMQARLVEGVLRGFSETAYKGNAEIKDIHQLADEKYSGKLPEAYKYIKEIPKLKATQKQILEWSGINQSSISCWARGVEALGEIGTKQYCFYYDRLAFDEKGQPIKNKNGYWKKEEVIAVDTLFMIKEIRNEENGSLKYYEITPSSIFLDQRESYFMLVPYNWREEVKLLVGNKKASSYTFRFLLFLRYQYELKRRSNREPLPYQIQWSPEEIAIAIKMPESIYRRKKKRMSQILKDAYAVAKRLGYLTDFEHKGYLDILTLNHDKYFSPKDISLKKAIDAMNDANEIGVLANKLFDLFHAQRKLLDPKHELPSGTVKGQQISAFCSLLKIRTAVDIENIILWSCSKQFWCTRLSSPQSILKHFSEAFSEFTVQYKPSKEEIISKNKKIASEIETTLGSKCVSKFRFDVLNKHVEIIKTSGSASGVCQPTCINYEDNEFEKKLHLALSKEGISMLK